MLRGFSFEFDDGVTPVSCDPVFGSAPTLQIETSRDEDFGYYERSLKTALTFKGVDYTYLKTLDTAGDCEEITLNIYKDGALFFAKTLQIGTSHFAFDDDRCRVTVQGDDVNAYACFLAAWDTEINILTDTTKVTVTPFFGTIETQVCSDVLLSDQVGYDDLDPDSSCLTDPATWLMQSHEVIQQDGIGPGGQDQRDYVTTWVREAVTVACSGGVPVPPPGDGWTLIADNCPTDADYARPLSGGEIWDNTTLSETVDVIYSLTRTVYGLEFDGVEISNGVLLSEILDVYLPCGLTVVSDLFSIAPDATHPANDVYDVAIPALASLLVYQKSDVKRPNAQNDATNGKWTIENLFGALKAQFDIEFRINPAGTEMRIEHSSYFALANGEDLTSTQPSRLTGTNRYTYASDKQISEEKWRFAEVVSAAFEGVPYLYDCFSRLDRQKKEYPINDSNNDVGSIISSPDTYADAGFVWINAYEAGGNYYMTSYASALTGDVLLNGHLSIPNLMRTYQTYNRPRLTGTWDGSPVTFDSQERVKVQDAISFKVCAEDFADYDESLLVRTGLGWMRIESGTYDAASGTFTVSPRG